HGGLAANLRVFLRVVRDGGVLRLFEHEGVGLTRGQLALLEAARWGHGALSARVLEALLGRLVARLFPRVRYRHRPTSDLVTGLTRRILRRRRRGRGRRGGRGRNRCRLLLDGRLALTTD